MGADPSNVSSNPCLQAQAAPIEDAVLGENRALREAASTWPPGGQGKQGWTWQRVPVQLSPNCSLMRPAPEASPKLHSRDVLGEEVFKGSALGSNAVWLVFQVWPPLCLGILQPAPSCSTGWAPSSPSAALAQLSLSLSGLGCQVKGEGRTGRSAASTSVHLAGITGQSLGPSVGHLVLSCCCRNQSLPLSSECPSGRASVTLLALSSVTVTIMVTGDLNLQLLCRQLGEGADPEWLQLAPQCWYYRLRLKEAFSATSKQGCWLPLPCLSLLRSMEAIRCEEVGARKSLSLICRKDALEETISSCPHSHNTSYQGGHLLCDSHCPRQGLTKEPCYNGKNCRDKVKILSRGSTALEGICGPP